MVYIQISPLFAQFSYEPPVVDVLYEFNLTERCECLLVVFYQRKMKDLFVGAGLKAPRGVLTQRPG